MIRTGSLRAREREFREFDSVNLLDVDDGFDLISEQKSKNNDAIRKKAAKTGEITPPSTRKPAGTSPQQITSPSAQTVSPTPSLNRAGRSRTSNGSFKKSEEPSDSTPKHQPVDDQLQKLKHKLSDKEEEVHTLKVRVKSLSRSNDFMSSRIKCCVGTSQYLASRAEKEKLKRHQKVKSLETSVSGLTELVEKLTQSVQAERSTNTTLQRKFETTEAASKRLMAENHRLELQLSRGTPSHVRQNSGDVSTSGNPIQQTDELWSVISELEASKNELTVATKREIQDLEAKLSTVTNEKEALWLNHTQEITQLTDELERQREKLSTHDTTVAELSQCLREKEDLWKECEQLSVQLSTQAAESTSTIETLIKKKEDIEKQLLQSNTNTPPTEESQNTTAESSEELKGQEQVLMELRKAFDDQKQELQDLKDSSSTATKTQAEEELKSQLAAVVEEKDELWKECERLASQRLDEESKNQNPASRSASVDIKGAAPEKSTSLQGITTHFGFVPNISRHSTGSSTVSVEVVKPTKPKIKIPPLLTPLPRNDSTNSEYSSSPPQPTESARENRRRALQEARNARKTEINSATHLSRQQSIAFDSIMDEVGAMKKAVPSTPTTR